MEERERKREGGRESFLPRVFFLALSLACCMFVSGQPLGNHGGDIISISCDYSKPPKC